jgi:hypothetical protein
MSDERPLEQILPSRQAGRAEAIHVRLSDEPSIHDVVRREDVRPEGRPTAMIDGPFRPIHDRGPATTVIAKPWHEPPDDSHLDGKEAE